MAYFRCNGNQNSNLTNLEYIGNYDRTTTSISLDTGKYLIIISSSSINTAGGASSIVSGAEDIKTIIQNNNTVSVSEGTAGNYINIFTARVTSGTPLVIKFGSSNARQTTIFKL